MDTPVVPDITDARPEPRGHAERVEAARRPALRRFVIDPASSPTLRAALAWDATARQHP